MGFVWTFIRKTKQSAAPFPVWRRREATWAALEGATQRLIGTIGDISARSACAADSGRGPSRAVPCRACPVGNKIQCVLHRLLRGTGSIGELNRFGQTRIAELPLWPGRAQPSSGCGPQ